MDYTDEHFYLLALSFVEGLTPYQKINLLEEKGSAEAIFLEGLPFKVDRDIIQNAIKFAEKECELMAKHNIMATFANNNAFPFRLCNCPDYPQVIFHKGKLEANRQFALSIVGSRKADNRGEKHVREMLEYLTPYKDNLVIVAGIASGVDAMVLKYAHKYGLYTVCVIPHGFGHSYDCNVERRLNMASCVVTENRFDFGYGNHIYEQRNRIIVGMSDAVVVAQAKDGNGAGLYIGKALDYNRDSYAFVYPDESISTEKCNYFVADDQAIGLNSAMDFFEKMIWPWG